MLATKTYTNEEALTLLEQDLLGQHESQILDSYEKIAKQTQNISLAEQGFQLAYSQADYDKAFDFALLIDDIDKAEAPATSIFMVDTALHQEDYAQAADLTAEILKRFPSGYYQSLADYYKSLPLSRFNYLSELKKHQPELENYSGYWQILSAAAIADNNYKQALSDNSQGLKRFKDDEFLRLQQVDLLSASGSNKAVDVLFETLANDAPNNEIIGLRYLKHELEKGNLDKAKAFSLTNASKIEDSIYILKQADLFNTINEFDTAEQLIAEVSDEKPDESNYLLAQIYGKQDQYAKSLALLETISDDSRIGFEARQLEFEIVLLQEDYASAEIEIDDMYDTYPFHSNEIIELETKLYKHSEQHLKAIALYSMLLKKQPDNTTALFDRALAAMYIDYDELVVSDLTAVLELEPDNLSALNGLGYYYADKGINLAKAETLLTKALSIDPLSIMVLDSWGWLRFKQGNYQEALKVIKSVYDVHPSDGEIASHLGEIYWAMGDKTKAMEVWKKAYQEPLTQHETRYLDSTLERLGVSLETD